MNCQARSPWGMKNSECRKRAQRVNPRGLMSTSLSEGLESSSKIEEHAVIYHGSVRLFSPLCAVPLLYSVDEGGRRFFFYDFISVY